MMRESLLARLLLVASVGAACGGKTEIPDPAENPDVTGTPGGAAGQSGGGGAAGSVTAGSGGSGQAGSVTAGSGGSGQAGAGGGSAGAGGVVQGGAGGVVQGGSGGSGQAGSGPAGAGGSGATEDPFEKDRQFCVDKINEYRASIGLPAYERWKEGEACADKMADHDADVQNPHDGFNKGICSPKGNGQNECPGYGSPDALGGCLAQMWAEGPSPNNEWAVAHGHYLNMVGSYTYQGFQVNFTRVACGFSSKGWFLQNFE